MKNRPLLPYYKYEDYKIVSFIIFRENLELMEELGDYAAQGRACGNLGNTLYLLGDFPNAIKHHTRRLEIAKQFGDRHAERRANSNLGNSHIFLGEFEAAAAHYKYLYILKLHCFRYILSTFKIL